MKFCSARLLAWSQTSRGNGVMRQRILDARLDARRHTREHAEDDPTITNWTWAP
jgi:phosphoketolase